MTTTVPTVLWAKPGTPAWGRGHRGLSPAQGGLLLCTTISEHTCFCLMWVMAGSLASGDGEGGGCPGRKGHQEGVLESSWRGHQADSVCFRFSVAANPASQALLHSILPMKGVLSLSQARSLPTAASKGPASQRSSADTEHQCWEAGRPPKSDEQAGRSPRREAGASPLLVKPGMGA